MHVSDAIKQVLIIVAILLVQPAYSIVWDDVETIQQEPTPKDIIKQYGLLANASMFLHFQTDIEEKYPTILLVCSEDQYYMIHDNERICEDINRWGRKPCAVVQSFVTSVRLMYYVPDYKEYYVSVVRCKGNAVVLKIHVEISNPNGNNLPSGLIPAATMLWLLAGVWGLILLCWLLVAYPNFKNIKKLQVVMMTFPVVKIVSSMFSAHYFHSFQVYGYSMEYWIEIVYNVLVILPLLDFHFVLLLISKSWSLSGSLTQSDLHFIFSMLVGLCCSLMFKNLYIGTNLTMLLSTLGYIGFRIVVFDFFVNVNQTIGRLESEMLHYNADVETINNRPIVVRLHKIFVLLKFALMLWVILNVAEFFCNILFFGGNNLNWIDLMNTEFIDILLSICIGILLLPHPLIREVIITERESSHEEGELEEAPENNNYNNEDNNNDNNNNNNNNNDDDNGEESTEEEKSTIMEKIMEEGTNENAEYELTTFSTLSSPSLSLSPLHPPNQRPNRASSFNNTISTSPPFHFDAISLDFTQDGITEQVDDTEENVDINGNKVTDFYNNQNDYNEHDYNNEYEYDNNNEYDEHSEEDNVSDDEVALVDRRKRNVQ